MKTSGTGWNFTTVYLISRVTKEIRVVAITNTKHLRPDDKWLLGGTYLAFLRIAVDIASWDGLNSYDQEIIIGRDKLTGCPLIGVD